MTIEFKLAEPQMADGVYNLIHQLEHDPPKDFFLQQFSEKLDRGDYKIYVALEKGEVIAFAEMLFMQFLHKPAKWAKLVSFCVDEKYRNKQIGSDFLRFLELTSKEKGCECLELISNIRRINAHRFYERNGYTEYKKMFIKRFE